MEIELINVNKSYNNTNILKNFNLSIEKGEMLAVTGESGRGKTTLLNVIGLIDPPDSGDIIIKGIKNPWNDARSQRNLFRYTLGYLFQNYALIENETVSKNLDIALEYIKEKNKNKIKQEALIKVGLLDKINNKIFELSGGEQQKVALARLLLKRNDIILADEPTGALDPKNRDEILILLQELNKKGKTIIIVTHDPEVAKRCSRRIVL